MHTIETTLTTQAVFSDDGFSQRAGNFGRDSFSPKARDEGIHSAFAAISKREGKDVGFWVYSAYAFAHCLGGFKRRDTSFEGIHGNDNFHQRQTFSFLAFSHG